MTEMLSFLPESIMGNENIKPGFVRSDEATDPLSDLRSFRSTMSIIDAPTQRVGMIDFEDGSSLRGASSSKKLLVLSRGQVNIHCGQNQSPLKREGDSQILFKGDVYEINVVGSSRMIVVDFAVPSFV